MVIPLLDLSKQYEIIKPEIQVVIDEVLESCKFIMGPNVVKLEQEIADFIGTKYAISCSNGTDALIMSLKALGIGDGDEVITTPFTFFATAEAISSVGAIPVFVDIDIKSYNINPKLIESKITNRTKAILPVHIFGQPAQMGEIIDIAKEYSLYVIEDACQSIGAKYKNIRCGSIGDIGCFSFFPTKNLGAYGDGGIITTNDERLANILKALRVHGSGQSGKLAYNIINNINENSEQESSYDETVYSPVKYYNYILGYNNRLDELQAAILRVKLNYLDKWNLKRKSLANRYNDKLKCTKLILPYIYENVESVYHLYILQSDERTELIKYLNKHGISTGVYYPVPLHLQKVYENLGYKVGDIPVAEYLSNRTFALPLYPELTYEQQDYIIETIKNFYGE